VACSVAMRPVVEWPSLALLIACAACRSSPPAAAPPDDAAPATEASLEADDACVIPSMVDQYPGSGLPTPFAPGVPAPECILQKHDVIVVLGCPNADDGGVGDCQAARADIAVALMQAGWGDRFITSGAAVQNQWVEADTLASLLVLRGVPDASITRERMAQHTDENILYSTEIMASNGWETALVVSDDPSHLVLVALCDSNCCVELGRLTVFDFPLPDGDGGTEGRKVGHYVRYPVAAPVTADECAHIEQPSKLMCIALPGRTSCATDGGAD
jgi:hypothetical protein